MKANKNLTYLESVHRDGLIWGLIICVMIFMFPLAVSLIFNVVPQWKPLAQGLFATLPMYWALVQAERIFRL